MKKYEKITTDEAAFAATGRDIKVLSIFDELPEEDRKYMRSSYIRMVWAEAIKNGWKPNYADRSQPKYFASFYFNGSAFVFSFSHSYFVLTHTYCGSRLDFKTREQVEYWATHITEHHNNVLLYENEKKKLKRKSKSKK